MAKKSVIQPFGRPTIGTQKKSKQFKSARAVKTLPRTGVLPEFIGQSPSKEWLARGTKRIPDATDVAQRTAQPRCCQFCRVPTVPHDRARPRL